MRRMTVAGACVVQDDAIEWELAGPSRVVAVGELFVARLTAKIADGWHVYSISRPAGGPMATSISMPQGQPFRLAGPIVGSAPETVWDEAFEMDIEYYAGAANFTIPVEIEANAATGFHDLIVEISFQGCSESACGSPAAVRVCVPITVASQA